MTVIQHRYAGACTVYVWKLEDMLVCICVCFFEESFTSGWPGGSSLLFNRIYCEETRAWPALQILYIPPTVHTHKLHTQTSSVKAVCAVKLLQVCHQSKFTEFISVDELYKQKARYSYIKYKTD